jgi:hypothetical protein
MKIRAMREEPIKPGWYIVEWGEFPASPALIYYDEHGWQRQPGCESFFGTHESDVWWDESEPSDFTKFLLKVLP